MIGAGQEGFGDVEFEYCLKTLLLNTPEPELLNLYHLLIQKYPEKNQKKNVDLHLGTSLSRQRPDLGGRALHQHPCRISPRRRQLQGFGEVGAFPTGSQQGLDHTQTWCRQGSLGMRIEILETIEELGN